MPATDHNAGDERHDRSYSTKAHFEARTVRYRNLLKEKWWLFALAMLLGLAVQGVIAWYNPPSFVSIGRMIVSIKLAIPEGSVYTEELSNFVGTQAALMQSSVVMHRAHLRVMAQKADQALRPVVLKVSVLPRTTIFVLKAFGGDAAYTQAFLQACMEEYIALKREMRTQTSDTTVAGLTEEVMRLEKDLAKAEEDLAAFQNTNSVALFQEEGNKAVNYVAVLYQRLSALKSEHELLQMLTLDQNLDRHQASDPAGLAANDAPNGPPRGASDLTDSEYFKAKQELLLQKADQAELGRYLRPKHPKMIAMSEDIARREGLLKIFREQGAEQLETRKETLGFQIQNLERDVKEWDAKALAIQGKMAEYEKLRANTKRIQALYDRLLATMQTLDVNKEISPESVAIMEPAEPAQVDRLNLPTQLALGGLAGLGVAVLVLLALERLDDRINSFTELQELFEEEVVGQVPREKTGRKKSLPVLVPEDERHALVEAYRGLRSSLLYMAEAGSRPKVLLVTSSVPNDGKSFTATNLAITLANSGSRVLLVDGDLRKGAIHERFEFPAEPGFSEVLSQGLNWETAVRATRFKNLSLLPRGAFALNSSELFVGEVTKQFLEAAKEKYDYVVLDSVPVMAADDVTSLAPHVDGVLFVIRAVFTSARVARASLESLYQRQARVLGLIFNAVPPRSIDYYYYKYRDYYAYYAHHPVAGKGAKEEKEPATKV